MPQADIAGPRILVVDDDQEVRDALVPALAARGWRVESAAGAEEGTLRLRAAAYDLVVVDLKDANGEGCAWLREARALRPSAKVLVMTAENTPANVICAIRENAFSYFSKPVAPWAVAEMVAQALEAPAWVDDIQVMSASPQWITLQVRCKMETADRLVQFMRELKADLSAELREDVAAALRELLLNAIEHGGGSDPHKHIRVSYIRTARAVVYHIHDPGPGFSFNAIAHAAVANPPGEPVRHVEIRAGRGVRPGGFGILLTRHLVDELIYNEKGNEVLFVKYLKK